MGKLRWYRNIKGIYAESRTISDVMNGVWGNWRADEKTTVKEVYELNCHTAEIKDFGLKMFEWNSASHFSDLYKENEIVL